MTLGAKLRLILEEENKAKFEAVRKARETEEKRLAAIRKNRLNLVMSIKEVFIDQITRGKNPEFKISATDQRAWVNSSDRDMYPRDHDLWTEFKEWLKSEDLLVKITEEHDGMGTADWIVVRAVPVPGKENEAD